MKYSRIIVCILVSLMMLSLACPAVLALEPFDVEQECTLNIRYEYDETPIGGARFDVYRVADVSADMVLTLSGAFADYPVELNGLSDTEFQEAAEQLQKYAEEDGLTADHNVVTDSTGVAALAGLTPGVYLVVGQPAVMDDRIHYSSPQLVILPMEDTENEEWDYTVIIQLKSISHGVDEELVDLSVLKKWEDEGYEDERPASVTVHLIWNDEIYDTVVLSDENNWTHTWTDLLPIGSYYVREDVPAGYAVDITSDGTAFILTNKCEDIDQTGQLWWPVPVMLALGLGLVLVGVLTRRSSSHEA